MRRNRKAILAAAGAAVLSMAFVSPAFTAEPVVPLDQAMYAANVDYGDPVAVSVDPYNADHRLRLDPANVIGPFDAVQSAGGAANDYFFGLAARTFSEYTFGEKFCNVPWQTDIQFAEVTWGSGPSWHTEAAQVYLTGAVVDGVTQADPYYVGVVWNRIGVSYVSAATRLAVAQSYSPDPARALATSELQTEGVQQLVGFHLPANVQSAVGVRLVDVTPDVYDLDLGDSDQAFPVTFLGVPGTGALLTLDPGEDPAVPANVLVTVGSNGNTDGYDLDAIRVYRCAPDLGTKTATGLGARILTKGTWFMYNTYTGGTQTFDIQLNNPVGYPDNIIGTYTIEPLGDGMYQASYTLDPSYTTVINGWEYGVEVVLTHLGISDVMSFTANPAKDDNADFGVPFYDADGTFTVFAHFVVDFT